MRTWTEEVKRVKNMNVVNLLEEMDHVRCRVTCFKKNLSHEVADLSNLILYTLKYHKCNEISIMLYIF